MALSSSYAHQRHLISTVAMLFSELLNLATMSLKRLNPLEHGVDLHKQRLLSGKKKRYMLYPLIGTYIRCYKYYFLRRKDILEPDVDDDTATYTISHAFFIPFFLSDCGILEEDDKTIEKKREETK